MVIHLDYCSLKSSLLNSGCMFSLKQVSNLLTGLGRFLILHYIVASKIAFTFAIVNLTRMFTAVNLLVCLLGVDCIYISYSKSNQSVYVPPPVPHQYLTRCLLIVLLTIPSGPSWNEGHQPRGTSQDW